jgi:hypothetical protein
MDLDFRMREAEKEADIMVNVQIGATIMGGIWTVLSFTPLAPIAIPGAAAAAAIGVAALAREHYLRGRVKELKKEIENLQEPENRIGYHDQILENGTDYGNWKSIHGPDMWVKVSDGPCEEFLKGNRLN